MTGPGSVTDVPADFQTFLERFEDGLSPLPDKPDETPGTTLKALWAKAQGRSLSVRQAADFVARPLDDDARRRLEALTEERLSGTPLAHLTGRQDFMGVVLLASPAALMARPETEILGYAAVDKAREVGASLIVDVCTGAGNLALGLAAHLAGARVYGSDIDLDAVELARENARFMGREDVEFRAGDLLEPFREPEFLERVDLLVCNPPYIPSRGVDALPREIGEHEPRLAFDGGPFGVEIIWRLVQDAPELLRPGGWLLIEVGAGQGPGIGRLLRRRGVFDEVEAIEDRSGEVRVLAARKGVNGGSPTDG